MRQREVESGVSVHLHLDLLPVARFVVSGEFVLFGHVESHLGAVPALDQRDGSRDHVGLRRSQSFGQLWA